MQPKKERGERTKSETLTVPYNPEMPHRKVGTGESKRYLRNLNSRWSEEILLSSSPSAYLSYHVTPLDSVSSNVLTPAASTTAQASNLLTDTDCHPSLLPRSMILSVYLTPIRSFFCRQRSRKML